MSNRRREITTARQANRMPGQRYSQLRLAARARGIPLEITVGQYVDMIYDAKCHYCLWPVGETGSGLDRKDSDLGYTLKNVVTCCGTCNAEKSINSYASFFAKALARRGNRYQRRMLPADGRPHNRRWFDHVIKGVTIRYSCVL